MTYSNSEISSRAIVLEQFREPLSLQRYCVPSPHLGEMVVRCSYGGVCGTDLHLQQGHLKIPTPVILGHEGLGEVYELGSRGMCDANGSLLKQGDRVMWASSIACGRCVPCRLHREPTLCENRRTYGVNRTTQEEPSLSGAWADYIYLREGTTVVKVPHEVDSLSAMAFACAGPTMVHALFERRPIRLGETVVVQGSGPVGLAASALAQVAGAERVIIIGGPSSRLEQAQRSGIGNFHLNIIDSKDTEKIFSKVVALTDGRGADLVIECTGVPSAIAQGLSLVRRGGSYLIVGQYTDAGETTFNPHQIVYRQLDVVGSWAFTGAHVVEYVKLLPTLIKNFDLKSLVTSYPLDSYQEAMNAVAAGSVLKAVLTTRQINERGS